MLKESKEFSESIIRSANKKGERESDVFAEGIFLGVNNNILEGVMSEVCLYKEFDGSIKSAQEYHEAFERISKKDIELVEFDEMDGEYKKYAYKIEEINPAIAKSKTNAFDVVLCMGNGNHPFYFDPKAKRKGQFYNMVYLGGDEENDRFMVRVSVDNWYSRGLISNVLDGSRFRIASTEKKRMELLVNNFNNLHSYLCMLNERKRNREYREDIEDLYI